jgi:hypothetical protein
MASMLLRQWKIKGEYKMKKAIFALGFVALASNAQAETVYFQKVYDAPNKTASNIESAMNLRNDKVIIQCDNGWLGKINFIGNVQLEPKDNKYRLTFKNFKADTGYQLAELPQNKESCDKAMNLLATDMHQTVLKWSDF